MVCSYCRCTNLFSEAWTQVLCRFKPFSWHVGDSWWWEPLVMVPGKNKAVILQQFVSHSFCKINSSSSSSSIITVKFSVTSCFPILLDNYSVCHFVFCAFSSVMFLTQYHIYSLHNIFVLIVYIRCQMLCDYVLTL